MTALSDDAADALVQGRHGDPFACLGLQADADGRLWARALLPGAERVAVVDAGSGRVVRWLDRRRDEGLFESAIPVRRRRFDYRLRIHWPLGVVEEREDPYRFGPVLGDTDLWLLGEGRHLRPYECLGAHPRVIDGVAGTAFAVWAPNARRAAVVGDFHHWDGRLHPMRRRGGSGVWELFLPAVGEGARYKYEFIGPDGALLPQRADPYALRGELRPATASVVAALPPAIPAGDPARRPRL